MEVMNMYTILDYVKWRGDLSFQQSPYQEVDYLILSHLAYLPFEHINIAHMTLNKAFSLSQDNFEKNTNIPQDNYELWKQVSTSKRFQNIKIINYTSETDHELIKQFASITFLLEDFTLFVAYRGTDDSLVGWHEDFLMLYQNTVPAQLSAVQYLQEISQYTYPLSLFQSLKNKNLGTWKERISKHFRYKKKGLPILLGGHSKGGNLAMYASIFADENIQERILHVYNYDGPGFQDDIIQSKNYQKMLPQMTSYIPHYSFFGIVLGHEEKYHVVASQNQGMYQHNTMSWNVDLNGFIQDELSYESVQFAIKVIMFLEKLNYQEKESFVEAMFNLFYSLDLHTFSDLSHMNYRHILTAIKEISLLNNQVRKMLIEVIHMIWLEAKKAKKL